MQRPLLDREDAFGRLLEDHLAGRAGVAILERDDGHAGPALPAADFFAEHAAWPEAERHLLARLTGRVLDVGAGAGRHSLEAQRRGCDVTAIDISPGAIRVCRRRGVIDVRLVPLAAVDGRLGVFDTILMMCGNFGLFGTAAEARRILATMHAMTRAGARILLDTVDPYVDADDGDIAYMERNRARGRMPGQVTIRLRYGERATPWFDLLNVSAAELETLAHGTGWRLADVIEGAPPDLYAALERRPAATP